MKLKTLCMAVMLAASTVGAVHAKTVDITLTAREVDLPIDNKGTIYHAWTFDGQVPGPVVHVTEGDTVNVTLRNDKNNHNSHSIDMHAAQVDVLKDFEPVKPGSEGKYTFVATHPGVFFYHCGADPMVQHIARGMFGAIIVDPATPLPAAKEFVLVQNEYYLAPAANGVQASDYNKMLAMNPDVVCFNGRPGQYQDAPIRVKRGDRVRMYVLSAGPSHPCNFHIVGEQFDTVYLGAPPSSAIHGVQTFSVAPGGGMIFEFVADVAGEFPFVNHGFGHGQKGAIGVLQVE